MDQQFFPVHGGAAAPLPCRGGVRGGVSNFSGANGRLFPARRGVSHTPLPSAEDRNLFSDDRRLFSDDRRLFSDDRRLFSDNRSLFSDDRRLRRKIPSLGIFLRSLRILKFSREFTPFQPPLVQGHLPQIGEVPAVYDQTVGVRGVRGVSCFFKLYMCRLVRLFA